MDRKASGDFRLPVDSEHKAEVFRPWTFGGVHMTAFHASWMSFLVSFLSTFAPAALLPVIRDDLDLQTKDIGTAGIATVSGVICARILIGATCDTIGPRYGHAGLMLLTAPAVFGMSLVNSSTEFIVCRMLIGFSVATFVACQYWSSVMFNVKIVGIANATGAGWGNAGGGVAHIVMPWIFHAFTRAHGDFLAWRYTFLIPGCLHIVIAIVILVFAQDLPDGRFFKLRSSGAMSSPETFRAAKRGLVNWRSWLMAWLYGYSFGIELTVQNVVVQYLFDTFDVNLQTAGILASVFGLLNIFARTVGGFFSDHISDLYGMRGRLAVFWVLQTVEGAFCLLVGLSVNSLTISVLMMGIFSLFVQASEGACYGIVPFISKRGLGFVIGLVGAGGNAGSAFVQFLFFRTERHETHVGFIYMGIMVMAMSQLILLFSFPQWGGVFFKPKPNFSEEDYYLMEYTEDEIAQGLANASLVFAEEAKSQRGRKRQLREREDANASDKELMYMSSSRQGMI